METAQGAPARTNTLAIVAFVCAFLVNIVGAILGIIALRQLRRDQQAGRGLAIAAIIVGLGFFVVNAVIGTLIFMNIVNS